MLTIEVKHDDTITRVTAKAVNALARSKSNDYRVSGSALVADVVSFLDGISAKYELANAASLTKGQKAKHTKVIKASAQAQARREATFAELVAHTDTCTEHAQSRECATCDEAIARWNRKDEHALAQADRELARREAA